MHVLGHKDTPHARANVSARLPFCIDQLRIVPHLSDAEIRRREVAVKEYFGWKSLILLEEEFEASVKPYYGFISHHSRQQPAEVINFLLNNGKPPAVSIREAQMTPLDVFALPFRHLHCSERIATLALDYGMTYDQQFGVC